MHPAVAILVCVTFKVLKIEVVTQLVAADFILGVVDLCIPGEQNHAGTD